MRRGRIRHLGLKLAILITLSLCILSIMMIMAYGFGGETPQTPIASIKSVTATPDGKIFIAFGLISQQTRYAYCGVILLPPGISGGGSSAQAKLWEIGQSSGFDYNSSIRMAISPPNPNELIGPDSQLGISNDSLVIDCSSLGSIIEGKWTLYLVDPSTTGLITSATWYVSGTYQTNQSLSFSRAVGHPDPMHEYGFAHTPQFWEDGYLWLGIFTINLALFFALVLVLAVITLQDRGRNHK